MDHTNKSIYTNTLQLFPRVVLLQIYCHLNIKSLFNCSLVNKHFNKLFDSDILWDNLLHRHYSADYIDPIKTSYNTNKSKLIYKTISDLLTVNDTFCLRKTIKELATMKTLCLFNVMLTSNKHKGNAKSLHKEVAPKSLPKEFRSLVNLQNFSLHGSKLMELPTEIKYLVNLQELYLDNNNLTVLPKEFGCLVNLRKVSLNRNWLTVLPTEIGCLLNLQNLDVSHN